MIVLDSNVWIAYLNKNDNQHKKAVLEFSKINDKILITEYIILEVCTILSIKVNKEIADVFLKITLSNKNVQVLTSSNDFFNKSVDYFLTYKKNNLSFIDISILNLSKNYKIITYDKALSNAILDSL